MPPYKWIHIESVYWLLAGGLVFALAIILARASRHLGFSFRKRTEQELEAETHEFGGGVTEQNRPMPLFIWLVTVGYFIWAVAYVIFSGARGL